MKLFRIILSITVFAACAPPPEVVPPPPPSRIPARTPGGTVAATSNAKMEIEIIHLVNVERMKHRLDTLVWNPALDKAAHLQAMQMADAHTMAHELTGAKYPMLKDRAQYAGYRYQKITENIAYGFPNAVPTVAAWMTSPGHRANILDRGVVETGVGVVRSKTGELYFCQVFGARLHELQFFI